MHLWPSQKIRNYYSCAYVSKFEWNLKQLRRSKAATSVCASDDRYVIREALISSSSPLPSSLEQRKDAVDPFSKIIRLVLLLLLLLLFLRSLPRRGTKVKCRSYNSAMLKREEIVVACERFVKAMIKFRSSKLISETELICR
ncbi:hypothetical protein KFK09_023566 [Dendrobium nobile]|uniref:Uncharacterized protein n=1 Tax=Dendrobium nobile TaxID=94219 RepID=A0A8T3ABA6_DENNO|nr:hypothetical protein KFK09_023566 [Dendrobium nobile]